MLIQDLALCEEADQATIQPSQHDDHTDAANPHTGLCLKIMEKLIDFNFIPHSKWYRNKGWEP